jgi:hypothetical protein
MDTNKPDQPAPEVLQAQDEESEDKGSTAAPASAKPLRTRLRGSSYRPSHKATFIGLIVVGAIIAVNVGVIVWLMNSQQQASADTNKETVTLSSKTLNSLGVSRNPVGDLGTELTIGPRTTFNSKVTMGSDLSIGGKLELKGAFSAASGNFTELKAGKTALGQLNVNGDVTASTLNLRKDLNVIGATKLQGPVTVSQLVTINNSLNVSGNVSVGGILSAQNFQANSLISGSTLTIGGHIISRGSQPQVGSGAAVGSNGTVSISGNDASGTVAVNAGTGAGSGMVALVAFHNQYGTLPHVLITPVGRYADVYVTRSIGGFNIYVNGAMSPGGYAFDYMVIQ